MIQDIKFCSNCGNRLDSGAMFCSRCGKKILEESYESGHVLHSNKCESCGANLRKLEANHYVCDYCGSVFFTNDECVSVMPKITEAEKLEVYKRAASFEVAGKHYNELQCLVEVADKLQDDVEFLVKLGRSYRRNEMYAKAMECYTIACSIKPEYANVHTNIGALYIIIKQYVNAEAALRRALELMNRDRLMCTNDDFCVAYSNMAIAVGMQGFFS